MDDECVFWGRKESGYVNSDLSRFYSVKLDDKRYFVKDDGLVFVVTGSEQIGPDFCYDDSLVEDEDVAECVREEAKLYYGGDLV